MDKLLFIMSRDNRLRTVIDEQNNLYQVRESERMGETRRGVDGGRSRQKKGDSERKGRREGR